MGIKQAYRYSNISIKAVNTAQDYIESPIFIETSNKVHLIGVLEAIIQVLSFSELVWLLEGIIF